MITRPYIYSKDIENNKITIATDKLGFYFFILRILKKFHPKDIVFLSKNQHKISQYLKTDEDYFVQKTYLEVFELAWSF